MGTNMSIQVPLLVIDRRRVSVMSTLFSNRRVDELLAPRWLPQVEGLRCSVAVVFPLAKIPRIESPETPSFNEKVSIANGTVD